MFLFVAPLTIYIVNNDVSGDDCVTAHDFLSLVLVQCILWNREEEAL